MLAIVEWVGSLNRMSKARIGTIAKALLAALFLINVYRAATQSLVSDEALTYQLYLAGPFSAVFTRYDANHHFLATLLMRLSMLLFGSSELALRLPTLLAGGWYFVTIYRLARLAIEEAWLFLLAVLLATANPLVLDFLVAARGYGLALACLTYGIYYLVVGFSHPPPDNRWLVKASLSFGLAITANLTVAFPVAVISAAVLIVLRMRRAGYILIPLSAIGLLFYLVSPIRHAGLGNFYYGAVTLWDSFRYLTAVSLAHNPGVAGWNAERWWKPWWRGLAGSAILAMSLAGAAIEIPLLFHRRTGAPRDWLLLFASVAFVGSWAALILAHAALGLPYPLDRTGLYFAPLAGLVLVCLAARLRMVSYACTALGTLIAIEFGLQVNWSHFYVWRYDADTKAIVNLLAAQSRPATVRLGSSWPLDPTLDYYRVTRRLEWLPPRTRNGPDGDYDYYILIQEDQDRIARYGLQVIYRGAISETVLAVKPMSVLP